VNFEFDVLYGGFCCERVRILQYLGGAFVFSGFYRLTTNKYSSVWVLFSASHRSWCFGGGCLEENILRHGSII
jgi:hypothetical protein